MFQMIRFCKILWNTTVLMADFTDLNSYGVTPAMPLKEEYKALSSFKEFAKRRLLWNGWCRISLLWRRAETLWMLNECSQWCTPNHFLTDTPIMKKEMKGKELPTTGARCREEYYLNLAFQQIRSKRYSLDKYLELLN